MQEELDFGIANIASPYLQARYGSEPMAAQVQDYERQYDQAVASAKKTAQETAVAAKSAATQGAFYAAIALILGALAAFMGGRMGAPKPVGAGYAYDDRRA